MTIETSNTGWITQLTDEQLRNNVRNYMEEGGLPTIFYDLLDEVLDRMERVKFIQKKS